MKKFSISSLLSQLLLLFFVIIWIIPTFGLFISSLRDKDLLAISGWWTSLTTTEVNEIYRMSGMESQIEEDGYFKIKGKLFEENSEKKIESFGITSKKINEFNIGDVAIFKDESEVLLDEDGNYEWRSKTEFKKKKGKRLFTTSLSPPAFTFENYREVLFKEGIGRAFINTMAVALPSTLIPLIICSFFAYSLTWMRFYGRDTLLAIIIAFSCCSSSNVFNTNINNL